LPEDSSSLNIVPFSPTTKELNLAISSICHAIAEKKPIVSLTIFLLLRFDIIIV
jgi:hypothetical protein